MPAETTSVFSQVIQEHLDLKHRNADLEPAMPIQRYQPDDPFQNNPLFKSEQQARLEETMDGIEPMVTAHGGPSGGPTVLQWPSDDSVEPTPPAAVDEDSGLWARSRDFDWGD
ncbi:MAG: hypothetical protein H0V84_04300 [Actinobacteria bacterium]|nr:hypothetical protein [Actinomycetota bacterium]